MKFCQLPVPSISYHFPLINTLPEYKNTFHKTTSKPPSIVSTYSKESHPPHPSNHFYLRSKFCWNKNSILKQKIRSICWGKSCPCTTWGTLNSMPLWLSVTCLWGWRLKYWDKSDQVSIMLSTCLEGRKICLRLICICLWHKRSSEWEMSTKLSSCTRVYSIMIKWKKGRFS